MAHLDLLHLMPFCIPVVECPPMLYIENTRVVTSGLSYNDNMTLTCISGFWFSRGIFEIIATCEIDATWKTETNNTVFCQRMSNPHIYFKPLMIDLLFIYLDNYCKPCIFSVVLFLAYLAWNINSLKLKPCKNVAFILLI